MNPRWDRMLQTSPGKIAVFGVFWGSPKRRSLWFIPMNSPTMEAKMMLRSAQQPTWRRSFSISDLGLLIGIRWVSRIPVGCLISYSVGRIPDDGTMGQKKQKSKSCSTIPRYTKPWRRALSLSQLSQLWHAVLCCAMLCWCGSGWAPCPEMRVAWPIKGARITAWLAKVSRTWMVAMANLLTKKWMT